MLLRVVGFFIQGYKIIFECSFLNRLLADGGYGAYKVDCVELSSGLVVVFGGLGGYTQSHEVVVIAM